MQPQTIAGHGVDDGQLVSDSFFQRDAGRRREEVIGSGEGERRQGIGGGVRRTRGLVAGRRQFQRLSRIG
ncbi:hypothetical protein Q3G72_029525 [Acer saccharum]|nr:hypothetical protein Q3G72_029525 [Acer saccharum]